MSRRKRRNRGFNTKLRSEVSANFEMELRSLVSSLGSYGSQGKEPYLASEIFSKYLDPSLCAPATRRQNAKEKWLATEQRNAKTNQRLLFIEDEHFGWVSGARLVSTIRSEILRVLGTVPEDVLLNASHTNGASTRVRRSPAAAILKLSDGAHVTSRALQHWSAFLYAYGSNAGVVERLRLQTVEIREMSTFFTVAKKSDIDRVACKEPELNMVLQRSVGLAIRRKLKRKAGIDLNDQTVNQRLASQALRYGLATIDLSAASDSVTLSLVQLLLPSDWWSLLYDLRVDQTLIDGEIHRLEMFSSMGNGFTFELESLLFYAITRAVMKLSKVAGKLSVYGDDIIAPTNIVPRLSRVFHFLGFLMNPKKTHYTGFFRESCGRHYWKGFDVTPFYVRKRVTTIQELILHLNHLLEWDGRGWGFFLTEEIALFWQKWSQFVPKVLWGGQDITSPDALVTGHQPRKRLKPITRPVNYDQLLGVDHWLWSRECTSEPLEVDPSLVVGFELTVNPSLGQITPDWSPLLLWSD